MVQKRKTVTASRTKTSRQNRPVKTNPQFIKRNWYKILGFAIGMVVVFGAILILLSLFLFSNKALVEYTDPLTLELIRIAFLIFATPVVIILFFIGKRIDDEKNASVYLYPVWLEILGLGIGIYCGWLLSTLWIVIIIVSLGVLWTNPLLYVPFPVITPLVSYLFFKAAQFIYSRFDNKLRSESFKIPLIIFILTIPLLIYSWQTMSEISQEKSYQEAAMITNFKQVQQGNKFIFTADMYVPQDGEYNVIGNLGKSPYIGTVRLNGIENIDRLNNFILTKGVNKLIFYPSVNGCSVSGSTATQSTVTFRISKVLAYTFTISKPKMIKENITCR